MSLRISSVAVGFAAGITSTILTGWIPLSDVGRGIVFVGSSISGAALAYWSSRATSGRLAFGRSAFSGAAQANIAGTFLVGLAQHVDHSLHISPTSSPPSVFGLAFIMLCVGSILGLFVGMAYGFVPAVVARERSEPSLASADRAMVATAGFLTLAAAAHSRVVRDWPAWAPLLVLASILATTALVRTAMRKAFLARVRAGREPRYRIEPAEGRSVLYRIAEEDDRESLYRENAAPPEEPRAVGIV
jgi:hypothetical protein